MTSRWQKNKIEKDSSLKFNISFYTDGIINQFLRFFTGKLDYSLDDINIFMKKFFVMIFIEK